MTTKFLTGRNAPAESVDINASTTLKVEPTDAPTVEELLQLLICEMFKMNQYLSYMTDENVKCDDVETHVDWPF